MSRTSTHDSANRSESLDVDQYYRALANHRRRIAIRVLEEDTSIDLEALTAAIDAREGGDSDREEIRICLVHQHLPLMADAGIVDYDEDERHVTLRQHVEELLSLPDPAAR